MELKIADIVTWAKEEGYAFSFRGDENHPIIGFSSLENCTQGKLCWIKKRENYDLLPDRTVVSVAVVQDGLELEIPNQIISANSKELFFAILHHFWGHEKPEGFIGRGTVTEGNIRIDPTAYIGYNCTIIGNVKIGAHTVIENNVVISGNITIGEYCHVQSSVVIGEDGFGYSKDPETGKKTMIEHFGGVRIGNNVFIGSHTNIASGTLDDTVLSDGVKVSSSTHIGHNNQVGENSTIIGSNLYGSVKTGANSYITASYVKNQGRIGDHSIIGMGSIVMQPIPDHVIAYGVPAKVKRENDSDL